MTTIPPIIVKVQAELTKFKSQMTEVANTVKGVGETSKKEAKNVGSMSDALKNLAKFAAGALIIRELTQVLTKAGHEAVTDSKSFEMMARTVEKATGASRDQMQTVDKQISKLAILSAIPDDKIRPAFTLMARNTHDVTKAMSMMQLALDVSAGTGRSLTSVTMALSRAMNGNTNALNRIVPEAKNVTDKFGYMKKVFDGAAEAAANNDPYARMEVIFSEMYESIGYALIPILNQFADWLTDMLPKVQAFFSQLTDPTTQVGSVWKNMTDTIAGLFKWITANIAAIVQWGTVLLVFWGIFKLGATVVMVYKTALEVAKIAQLAFNAAADANPILLLASAIAVVTAGLWAYSSAADAANSIDLNSGDTNAYDDAINAYDKHMATLAKYKAIQDWGDKYFAQHPEMNAEGYKITPEMADPTSEFYHYIKEGYKVGDYIPGSLPMAATIAGDKAYKDELTRLQNLRAANQAANNMPAPTAKQTGLEQYMNSFAVLPEKFIEEKLGRIESAVVKKAGEIQGELVKSLNAGEITETATLALSSYADNELKILQKIGKARDVLADKYNLAKTLMGSVGESVKKALNVADLGTTADSVVNKFRSVGDAVLGFAKNLKTLKDRGLSTDFISQIASAGFETGGALALGLSNASAEQIAAVNGAFQTVQRASAAASESIAQSVYGDGKDVTNGLLAGIISQDKVLLKTATSMGQRFAKTFAAAIKLATGKDDKAFLKAMAKWEVDNLPSTLVLPTAATTPKGDVSLVNNYSVDVTANTQASPSDIANQTMSAIKFGIPTGVSLTGVN